MDGFLEKLGETIRDEAPMHRLWYDLRAQALFEDAFRPDVAGDRQEPGDDGLAYRLSRYRRTRRQAAAISPPALYALFDGLFQKALFERVAGNAEAVADLLAEVRSCCRRSPDGASSQRGKAAP